MPKPSDGKSSSKISPISSIRSIRYLTCQGGGMKGLGDVGAIEQLEETGVLAQLEEVAGSSAGGLIAIMVALGCTAQEIREEMLNINFIALQDKDEPGWLEATQLKHLFKSGGDIADGFLNKVKLIKSLTAIKKAGGATQNEYTGIAKAIDVAEKAEDVVGLMVGADLGLWKGDAISRLISNLIAKKTGKPDISFEELAALSQVKGSPFKKLHLTGSNITEGKLEYYNATNTPKMSVVTAGRITSSFPGGYKPVISTENGQTIVRVDGGLLENLPDVFNKEPYISSTDLNEQEGNSKAFALVFKDPKKPKHKNIKNGIDLIKALYSAKMSEDHLHKKYGNNIAYIDPVGIDTLDFHASSERRMKLIESGGLAIKKAFQKVLNQENNFNNEVYNNMEIDELIRREVALRHMLKENDSPSIYEHIKRIRWVLNKKNIPEDTLNELRLKAEERYERIAKQTGVKPLTDKELSELCERQFAELKRVDDALKDRYQQLKLARQALQFNRELIVKLYNENKQDNFFYKAILELRRIDGQINALRKEEILGKATKEQVRLIEQLEAEKNKFIQGIEGKYKRENNETLASFFKNLGEDMYIPGFKIPDSPKNLWKYCSIDIEDCTQYINQCRSEMRHGTEALEKFRKFEKSFSERTHKASRYSTLLNYRSEIEKSLYNKTTLLSKIDHYLYKKSPRFERIMRPFLKLVGFVSFAIWLPLGIPFVGLAKLVEKSTKSPGVKNSVQNAIKFFSMSDLDYHHHMRGLKETTTNMIKTMSDNYVKGDKSQASYIHMLYAIYLKNNNVKLENIFMRGPEESKEEYLSRLEIEREKLNQAIFPNKQKENIQPSEMRKKIQPIHDEMVINSAFDALKKKVLDSIIVTQSTAKQNGIKEKVEKEKIFHLAIIDEMDKHHKSSPEDAQALVKKATAPPKKHSRMLHVKYSDFARHQNNKNNLPELSQEKLEQEEEQALKEFLKEKKKNPKKFPGEAG